MKCLLMESMTFALVLFDLDICTNGMYDVSTQISAPWNFYYMNCMIFSLLFQHLEICTMALGLWYFPYNFIIYFALGFL